MGFHGPKADQYLLMEKLKNILELRLEGKGEFLRRIYNLWGLRGYWSPAISIGYL